MAIREKHAHIAEPSTTARRLLLGATTTASVTQAERRRIVLLHPRPGRCLPEPSRSVHWGGAQKVMNTLG